MGTEITIALYNDLSLDYNSLPYLLSLFTFPLVAYYIITQRGSGSSHLASTACTTIFVGSDHSNAREDTASVGTSEAIFSNERNLPSVSQSGSGRFVDFS